jgi:hypothetical protein
MKKNIFIFICILKSYLVYTQDSLAIFKMNSSELDSFMLVKQNENLNLDLLSNIFISKLSSNHIINKNTYFFFEYSIVKKIEKEESCDSLLLYHMNKFIAVCKEDIAKVNLLLHKYYPNYSRDSRCNRDDSYKMSKINASKYLYNYLQKNNLEHDLLFLQFCNQIANIEGIDNQEQYLFEVLKYPFWQYGTIDRDKMLQMREEYIKAGKALLHYIRGDLKALERTFFEPSTEDELEVIKKIYIEELGGTYESIEQKLKRIKKTKN